MRWGWWCDGDGRKVCVGSGVSVILGQLRGRRPHDRASLREQNLSANMLHGRQAAANPKFFHSLAECRHTKVNVWMSRRCNYMQVDEIEQLTHICTTIDKYQST